MTSETVFLDDNTGTIIRNTSLQQNGMMGRTSPQPQPDVIKTSQHSTVPKTLYESPIKPQQKAGSPFQKSRSPLQSHNCSSSSINKTRSESFRSSSPRSSNASRVRANSVGVPCTLGK